MRTAARLLVLAWLATGCGPINFHVERHTDIHNVIIRCQNPEDQSTCHETKAPEVESP